MALPTVEIRKNRAKLGTLLAVLLVLPTSCVRDDDAGRPAATYRDGSYAARYRYFDAEGFRPVLQIAVVEGRIVAAEFEEIGSTGTVKSLDPSYRLAMEPVAGTYPGRYSTLLEAALLEAQSAPVDAVAGATESSVYFNELARAALENARIGNPAVAVLPMDETYRVEDAPDADGWAGTLTVRYRRGDIVQVEFDEVRRQGGVVVARKSTDRAYTERYEAVSGLMHREVFELLEDVLEERNRPDLVDTIAGATLSSNRFRRLAIEALAIRFGSEGLPF